MYFSSLYRRGVRSSQTKTCCLSSIFLSFRLLVRNSFLFLYDTNLAMIGRGFSLFLLICPSCLRGFARYTGVTEARHNYQWRNQQKVQDIHYEAAATACSWVQFMHSEAKQLTGRKPPVVDLSLIEWRWFPRKTVPDRGRSWWAQFPAWSCESTELKIRLRIVKM